MDIVQVGVIYNFIPAEVEGEPPAQVALPGWHVDSLQPITGAEEFLITVSTPRHGFAGVPDSDVLRYKFDSKEQFESLLAEAVGAVNGPVY